MTRKQLIGRTVGIESHLVVEQGLDEFEEVAQTFFVDKQTVQGVADGNTAGLGIADDSLAHLEVALFVKVCIYYTGTSLDDRNACSVAYEIDETTAATGNAEVDVPNGIEQLAGGLMGGRQQGGDVWVDTILLQYLVNQFNGSLIRQVGI